MIDQLHLICKQHKHGHYHTLLEKLIEATEKDIKECADAAYENPTHNSLAVGFCLQGRLEILELLKNDLEYRMVE